MPALVGELSPLPLEHSGAEVPGLAKLDWRTGKARAGPGATHHCDDDVPRDGHALLAGAGGGGDGSVIAKLVDGGAAKAAETTRLPSRSSVGLPP
jgi:hypothetical protein